MVIMLVFFKLMDKYGGVKELIMKEFNLLVVLKIKVYYQVQVY